MHDDSKELGHILRPGHRLTSDRRGRPGKASWQHLFGAIDDRSRLGSVAVSPDETPAGASAVVDELVAFCRRTRTVELPAAPSAELAESRRRRTLAR